MTYQALNLPAQAIQVQTEPLAVQGENDLSPSEFKNTPTKMVNVLKKKQVGVEKRGGQVKEIEEGSLEMRGGFDFKGSKYFVQDDELFVNDGTLGGNTVIHTFAGVGEATFAKFGDYLHVANGTENPVQVIGVTASLIADAPVCGGVFIHDQRLVLYKIDGNESQVLYSEKFDPLAATPNPPFQNFTTIATPPLPTDPGSTSFSNAGAVTSLLKLKVGNQLIAFYEDGESGIVLDTINVDTQGLRQSVRIDFQGEGLGADNSVATRDGVVIVNEGGVWFSPIQTETAYPFSLTSTKISEFFGEELTSEIDFVGSSMIYDEDNNRVLISCKKDASFNNFVLVFYMTDKVATNEGYAVPYSRITGWYIKNFFKVGRSIWGTSSINGKIYELFQGFSDDGTVIPTRYRQEVTRGTQNDLKAQEYFTIKGFFADEQVLNITFDIYDQMHILREDYTTEVITIEQLDANIKGSGFQGVGEGGIGEGAIGGTEGFSNVLSEQWFRRSVEIYEYTRLIIDIEEESLKPWEIDYMNTESINKGFNQNIR